MLKGGPNHRNETQSVFRFHAPILSFVEPGFLGDMHFASFLWYKAVGQGDLLILLFLGRSPLLGTSSEQIFQCKPRAKRDTLEP